MSKRNVFFSFHYKEDNWRASQTKNMGVVEGNQIVTPNKWEEVKAKGDKAIQDWIDANLRSKSCTVVLIGSNSASRKWIKYEIKKSWEDGKGLVGIYVHNLKDKDGNQSNKGKNPFDNFTVGDKKLSSIVKCYDPPYSTSTNVYDYIKKNLADWVEAAIQARKGQKAQY